MTLNDLIQSLDSTDTDLLAKELKRFNSESLQQFHFPELKNSSIRKKFWSSIHGLLKSGDSKVLVECLQTLRIVGRDKNSLDPEIQEDCLQVILRNAELLSDAPSFSNDSSEVIVEAQKCLCNIIYNSKYVLQYCCNPSILKNFTKLLDSFGNENISIDVKYFHSKLLFLVTALCPTSRDTINEFGGLLTVATCLQSVVQNLLVSNDSDQVVQISCELLKSLFNLLLSRVEVSPDNYIILIDTCKDILVSSSNVKPASHELQRHTVNLLCNIPCQYYSRLVNLDDGNSSISFLDHDMSVIHDLHKFLAHQLDSLPYEIHEGMTEGLCPVLKVLTEASRSERSIRKYLKSLILPPLKDVHHRPEEGITVRNKLCRLLTHPVSEIKDITADFLFILCKENVHRMVKYTGYGNAAGMLAQKGLLLGNHESNNGYSSDSEDSDTDEYRQYMDRINPITGCYEEPKVQDDDQMTEEQKEYEAMRLVTLLDRMSHSGLIQPATVGEDGRPRPIQHVLQLQDPKRLP